MTKAKTWWIVAGVVTLFCGLAAAVIALRIANQISGQMALLMLVALIGLYVGLGILFVIYRFVDSLD